ncbi:DUF983 domain-containing protein [Novosphingopyxis sp.]|uniref:DUF983 domain-containing protein n=1 Tax=Novosphingopyxis sp. TaxID=2709690 RepID=UPI003B5A65F7
MADAPPELIETSLKGLCPRCGAQTLFAGLLRFDQICPNCGLDFDRFNVGDGASAALILLIETLFVVLAIIVQLSFSPPFWVHIILWVPLATAATILGLRGGKAAMLWLEYRSDAGEGRAG